MNNHEVTTSFCQKCGTRLQANGCPLCGETSQQAVTYSAQELEEANKKIKAAVTAAVISGTLTAIFAVFEVAGFSRWELIDAGLVFGLAFGIYRKSRACAVILFAYWIFAKVFMLADGMAGWFGLPIAIVFGVYFFRGILGTFAYQRIKD